MTPMFSIFTQAIKFVCVFLTIFQSFHLLFVSFIFNKLAPHQTYVSKGVLNHNLVHANAFNGLKSAKNVVFFSFCVLVDMPMGGGGGGGGGGAIAPPPWLRYWMSQASSKIQNIFLLKSIVYCRQVGKTKYQCYDIAS